MVEQLKRYKKLKKEIKNRTKQMPFQEGVYIIRHPLCLLFPPRLKIQFNKKRAKVKGEVKWLRYKQSLEFESIKQNQLVLYLNIEAFTLDIVLNFYKKDAFSGFLDTPIGQFKFTGRYVKSLYGG